MKKWILFLIGGVDLALLLVIGISAIKNGIEDARSNSTDFEYSAEEISSAVYASYDEDMSEYGDDVYGNDAYENDGYESIAAPFETSERPTQNEFAWFREDVIFNGAPSNVIILPTDSCINGGWKGYILYDKDNTANALADELINVVLDVYGSSASMIVDQYYYRSGADPENPYSEEDEPDISLTGTADGRGISLEGAGNWHITTFYEIDGMQYAYGTIDGLGNGITADVALVRP